MLNHIEESIKNWQDGKATDNILDFTERLTKLTTILFHKLKTLGIISKWGVWIREFLTKEPNEYQQMAYYSSSHSNPKLLYLV